MVKAIVGANWGDEGKGKITDMLAAESDVIIRFQGGANAGHTIINDYGKFALHTLPSGVFYKHTMNIVGNGVALHIPTFINEVNAIVEQGAPQPQLMVSDRAQMMMPYHILLDTYEENRLKDRQFGSTKSGIAPFYAAVGSSQVISNVPAAVLLSGFTNNWTALIVGTNLGGLGTPITSMASLISLKIATASGLVGKRRYLAVFTAWNVAFLAVLCAANAVFGWA